MATSAAAMLLDELMGRDRNLAPTEKRRETHWDDPETCKYFLCGFCPHELFVNTRADLGPCDKIHDEELKKGYQKSPRREHMGYEDEFVRFLQSLISDVERRIKRGHARLALNASQAQMAAGQSGDNEEQIEFLTQRISELVQEAEDLGCEGKVEESQGVLRLCDQLRDERTNLESAAEKKGKIREDELAKKMEVCNVCGALLVAGDAQQRIDEHIMGKQHMGYARIRVYIEQRQAGIRAAEVNEEERLEKERLEKERIREEERKKREEERELEKKKEQEREKERERRRRSRSTSRSKKRRSRSRSKGRHRNRDHDRRDRDRRDHSRERRKRSRSRDRDRERRRSRSRSRSQHSSRSKGSSRRSSREKDRDSKRSRSQSRDQRDKDQHSRSKDENTKDKALAEDTSNENGGGGDGIENRMDSTEPTTNAVEEKAPAAELAAPAISDPDHALPPTEGDSN